MGWIALSFHGLDSLQFSWTGKISGFYHGLESPDGLDSTHWLMGFIVSIFHRVDSPQFHGLDSLPIPWAG